MNGSFDPNCAAGTMRYLPITLLLVFLGVSVDIGWAQIPPDPTVPPYPDPWSLGKDRPRRPGISGGVGKTFISRDERASQPRLSPEARSAMARIQGLLYGSSWKKAHQASTKLLNQLTQGKAPTARELATVVVLRAVAELGLERSERALWSWHVAQALHRGVEDHDFTFYVIDATVFTNNRLRRLGEPPLDAAASAGGSKGRTQPVHLPSKRGPALAENEGEEALVVELVVDVKGLARQPVVVHPAGDLARTYRVLEALFHLRFKPATASGNPTAVLHRVRLAVPTTPG